MDDFSSTRCILDESSEWDHDEEDVKLTPSHKTAATSYPEQLASRTSINCDRMDSGQATADPLTSDKHRSGAEVRNRATTNSGLLRSIDQVFYNSMESQPNRMTVGCLNGGKSKMSSNRIPGWAWTLLVHILGIKCHESNMKTKCLAIFLQLFTILIACTFTVSGVIHTVYDVMSKFSDTTLLIGIVNLILGFSWICLGIYSNKLSKKLFSNRNFVESVRIHSRTFFKVSAAGLLIFLGTVAIIINGYIKYTEFGPRHCQTLNINTVICHVMYTSHVSFSVISLLWNLLVGCMLLSVCRTHTIGVRRFIRVLEHDAKLYMDICSGTHTRLKSNSDEDMDLISCASSRSEWFIWDDDGNRDGFSDSSVHENTFQNSRGIISSVNSGDQPERLRDSTLPGHLHSRGNAHSNGHTHSGAHAHPEELSHSGHAHPASYSSQFEDSLVEDKTLTRSVLSNEELLMCYWKISHRMRITSTCLQRWLASWILFVLVWCGDYILYWISHDAIIWEVIECIIPLLLLLIVCSAFAEANGEGQRMIRCICPTENRLKLLYFLTQQPLQMQVFNFSITYNAVFGVVAAFTVAFASRIILDEVYSGK
ncbi:uncharacterized protein LOC110443504 [Mizuhopecten yessoensis]|uniref:Uncharacterized protein n=1 Tax=Mizuhopecten yessoensis TaxID=6573 RepID=A0A210PES8_MIZYE|nr:uncharacterized protein LOC110443504 [Mizuhopecten yessoensis]OWF34992.1 hypothetical protein KP79_PYT23813 [Mizuhopecten yessoensis]